MKRLLQAAVLVLALLGGGMARAQSGIRGFYCYDWTFGASSLRGLQYGVGFDHDLNPHLAFGVDLTYTENLQVKAVPSVSSAVPYYSIGADNRQYGLNYRACYLIGDNDGGRFYLGSRFGVRRSLFGYGSEGHGTWSVPLGLRLGLRGTLPGTFGDIYLETGGQLGGRVPGSYGGKGLTGFEVSIGFAFGFGWE